VVSLAGAIAVRHGECIVGQGHERIQVMLIPIGR